MVVLLWIYESHVSIAYKLYLSLLLVGYIWDTFENLPIRRAHFRENAENALMGVVPTIQFVCSKAHPHLYGITYRWGEGVFGYVAKSKTPEFFHIFTPAGEKNHLFLSFLENKII